MSAALWVVALLLAQDGGVAPRPPKGAPAGSARTLRQKVEIDADKLEILGKGNQLVWTGNVRARRGTTKLSCNRLVAHYTNDQQISRIECEGDVEIVDGDRWARGERAEFDNVNSVLVVTGDPQARQGVNHMRGSKVTFYMERDVVEVQDAKVIVHSDAVGAPKKP